MERAYMPYVFGHSHRSHVPSEGHPAIIHDFAGATERSLCLRGGELGGEQVGIRLSTIILLVDDTRLLRIDTK